jgi:hypothetical protein
MAVKPHELETPERGMHVQTRRATEDQESVAMDALLAMRKRLEDLRVTPTQSLDPRPHCADCFARGVRAAIGAIEGEPRT